MGQKIRLYGHDKIIAMSGKIKVLEELQAKSISKNDAALRLGLR